jgi:malate dehydrogenase
MAQAGAKFVDSLLKANTTKGVKECTYIQCDVVPGLEYFSTIVELGPKGVAQIEALPAMDEHEKKLMSLAVPELKKNIQKGKEFVANAK